MCFQSRSLTFKALFVVYVCTVMYVYMALMISRTNSRPGRESPQSSWSSNILEIISRRVFSSLEDKMYPDLHTCQFPPPVYMASQRGVFWVLENYIPAEVSFRCNETITFTTHGDFTFLDNLEPLTDRWKGPVSMTLYASGTDFPETLDRVLYLRECGAGVKQYVTFHFLFHESHKPPYIPTQSEALSRKFNCSEGAPVYSGLETYRKKNELLYPINIARNAARRAARTYFIFPVDVELYPSLNFIPDFFEMLKKPDKVFSKKPRVFVFPIFEVELNATFPDTKSDLVKLLKTGEAIPFHKNICARCHLVPRSKKWEKHIIKPGLSVFTVGKRTGTYSNWEPIYVGTQQEPFYDERLSWEGRMDKMTQMYILCVRDYEFHILDNAFLVHRPGIKLRNNSIIDNDLVKKQSNIIHNHIIPEYSRLFGRKKQCSV